MARVEFWGHAAFKIVSPQGRIILIDPWISGNELCPVKVSEVKDADLILVTHDHFDHIGEDIPALTQQTGAIVIGQPEVMRLLGDQGVKDDNLLNGGFGMNIGGTVEVKGIKVTMTQALHTAGAGAPCGYIIKLEDGYTIYHAGDTGIFYGMKLLGEMYNIDLALLPIGSNFVMDPYQAATALTLLKPRTVIPMHYKTIPILVQDTAQFEELAAQKAPQVKVEVISPGEVYNR